MRCTCRGVHFAKEHVSGGAAQEGFELFWHGNLVAFVFCLFFVLFVLLFFSVLVLRKVFVAACCQGFGTRQLICSKHVEFTLAPTGHQSRGVCVCVCDSTVQVRS